MDNLSIDELILEFDLARILFAEEEEEEEASYVVSLKDITERKQVETALHHQTEVLQTIFDNIPVMIALLDHEGRHQLVNRYWQSTLGWSLEEAQHTDVFAEFYPDLAYQKYVRDYVADSAETWGDFKTRTRDGCVLDTSWVNVPLSDGSIIGIGIDITERKRLDDQIRQSKEQLEQFNQRLVETIENERARISREIHDELGQSLTAIKIDLNWLRDHPSLKGEIETKLVRMIDVVNNTIKDVQKIASDLRPDILEDLGLVPAIEWYCEEFETRTDILCEADLEEIESQNTQLNLALFRVMQEALTNVARHAHATNVSIKLRQTKSDLILEIIDNGIGIDEHKISSHKSIGIVGMRERVRPFDGRLEITSLQPKGTHLTVLVQL